LIVTALVIRLVVPPLSVRVRLLKVKVAALIASENVTSTESTGVFLGFGVTAAIVEIQLQIAQVEAELGKALASLARAVGSQINEHPPAPAPDEDASATPAPPPQPPPAASPFRTRPAGATDTDRAGPPLPR
jgi:hypothetical protein